MRSRTSACRSSGSRLRSSATARRRSAFCATGGRRTAVQLRSGHRLGAAPRDFRADGGVRLIRMLKPKRLRPGDKVAIVAPASSFLREEFDKGVAEIQRLGFEPVFEESVFAQHGGYLSGEGRVRARGVSQRVARSVRARAHRRARRLWQRAPASISRTGGSAADAESLHRLQRSDDGAHVSDRTAAASSRSMGRCSIAGLSRGIDAYDRDSFVGALTSAEPLGELGARAARDVQQGRGRRSADGRHARAAGGVARHAVRVRSAQRATCCFSKMSASVRSASIAW